MLICEYFVCKFSVCPLIQCLLPLSEMKYLNERFAVCILFIKLQESSDVWDYELGVNVYKGNLRVSTASVPELGGM